MLLLLFLILFNLITASEVRLSIAPLEVSMDAIELYERAKYIKEFTNNALLETEISENGRIITIIIKGPAMNPNVKSLDITVATKNLYNHLKRPPNVELIAEDNFTGFAINYSIDQLTENYGIIQRNKEKKKCLLVVNFIGTESGMELAQLNIKVNIQLSTNLNMIEDAEFSNE